MTLDKILVTIAGLLGIGFTYWFFLMRKQEAQAVSGSVDVIVDGGYTPEVISVPRGEKTVINFLRKDPSSCLEEVVLSDFKVRKQLPLNKRVSVEITPQEQGEFTYSCGMNMFHGKIIVQ